MKDFTVEIRTEKTERRTFSIKNVSHNIPVWLYSPVRNYEHGEEKVNSLTIKPCHFCKESLGSISIPCGFGRPDFKILKTCTVIQTEDGRNYAMHKYCFDKNLKEEN